MKKILIVTLEHPPQIGGIATYVDQLAQALPNKELAVLAPKHPDAATWDAQQTYPIIRKNLLFPSFLWPRWIKLCFVLWSLVRKHGFDMIYIHHILPVGYAAWFIKKVRHIPFVIFSHGTDITAAAKKKWKARWAKKIADQAEQIITNSESLQRRLIERFPTLEKKSTVLYPSPDTIFFSPPSQERVDALRSQYALEGKKVILSIARLTDGKGFPHLIRIMPEILKKVPNVVWFIVGDGPKKDYILREIQRYDLQNVVRFVGQVAHEDLHAYYYAADAFVLLTHPDMGFEEGLGLVFLEAGAAGLPIIAGRSGGVEEAVIHGKTGLVVDTYQDMSVISAMNEILSNEEFAKKLGSAAQERAKATFRWSTQIARLETWH